MSIEYILDTNVLLDYPQIITKEKNWVVPYEVLNEIDGLKMSHNIETAKKARKAAVYLSKNMDNISWDFMAKFPEESVDDMLIRLCQQNKNAILITNDVALKVKASTLHIPNEGYSWKEDYVGVYYVNIDSLSMEEYNEMLGTLINDGFYEEDKYEFSINEYLIVPPFDNGSSTIFKYDGKEFNLIRGREIQNNWIGSIFPRNDEQVCLVDSLLNKTPIVFAGGVYGSGKTFLTHNYAIGELERDRIKKIVYVPNNSYTQNTMDLGALPGSLMDKIIPLIGPLIDLVGIDQVQRWVSEEKLEIVPISYIRGRSFNDSIMLVSEAENLTEEHIKLLLARCGENTRIFFDGDIHQADSAIFKDRNGLKLLLNLHKSPFAHNFSTVQLNTIERSEVAATADFLDKI